VPTSTIFGLIGDVARLLNGGFLPLHWVPKDLVDEVNMGTKRGQFPIKLPTGVTGTTGATGVTGATGITGVTGSTGAEFTVRLLSEVSGGKSSGTLVAAGVESPDKDVSGAWFCTGAGVERPGKDASEAWFCTGAGVESPGKDASGAWFCTGASSQSWKKITNNYTLGETRILPPIVFL
jgi:hypothetical protein